MKNEQIARFLAEKRRERGLTQQQLAERLGLSFQAVSKWEQGTSLPGTDLLLPLAEILEVTVDELLHGAQRGAESLSYRKAGVDIATTDAMKQQMAAYLQTTDHRVLNQLGAFASLYDISFADIRQPVLVLKAEEPGSKQKLAFEYGFAESICHDMINHLVNDIIVMGARPLAVLDTIICAGAEAQTIVSLVKGIADACRANECTLVGGETSIQPNVVGNGVYILTSSIAGIVDRHKIIDGSATTPGDRVLAVASGGLHTNGYSLVRLLMEQQPQILLDQIEGMSFLEKIMQPHRAYYPAVKALLGQEFIHAMAHITGGGIVGNLRRVIPQGLSAHIDLAQIQVPPLFSHIKTRGNISQEEMLATFNCGVGLVLVVKPQCCNQVMAHINRFFPCYEIGEIVQGNPRVEMAGKMRWK